ncbi:MAG: DnaJ C-terminal domain-containing protein [Polyangiaceae bacterium]
MAADYYKELGVARGATDAELKKAYRKLAAQLHPDKNPGDKKIEARFKNVNRAYQALSDKEKRSLYDEFGEEGLREGFNSQAARAYRNGGPGPAGYRRGSTGGGGGGPSSKGSDIASEVSVDFISALRGAELKLRLQDGGDEITVRVPPGAGDGDKVRIAGQGAPGAYGGPPGDLILNIRVTKHPHFERSGLDLYLDLPITVGEAYRGAKVRVPTPDGAITLTVPKHAQSGQIARLKGRGVKRKAEIGDLYIRFQIKLPVSESEEIEAAVTALETAMTGDVRADVHF